MIRVMLVDDHAMVRAGLGQLLESADDIEIVGEAASGAEAVGVAKTCHPDVVLMDVSMPDVDGIEAIRRLKAAGVESAIVVLTSFTGRERILAAVEAGATGYLLKDSEPADLIRGVRSAAAGDAPFDPKAARVLVQSRSGSPSNDGVSLTTREREVLGLVVSGSSNKQIARTLGISEKTVKAHLTSTFQRLGVSDRTQAALWAERNGLGLGAPT